MKKIKIMLDYQMGPIWKNVFDAKTGESKTGIEAVDNNKEIQELNNKISDIYNSYYEFNSHNQAVWFNAEKEKKDKQLLLGLISQLIEKINEISDGSFQVEDCETERIHSI